MLFNFLQPCVQVGKWFSLEEIENKYDTISSSVVSIGNRPVPLLSSCVPLNSVNYSKFPERNFVNQLQFNWTISTHLFSLTIWSLTFLLLWVRLRNLYIWLAYVKACLQSQHRWLRCSSQRIHHPRNRMRVTDSKLTANLTSRQDLPTHESPRSTSLNRLSLRGEWMKRDSTILFLKP